jgi:hypothetical protein
LSPRATTTGSSGETIYEYGQYLDAASRVFLMTLFIPRERSLEPSPESLWIMVKMVILDRLIMESLRQTLVASMNIVEHKQARSYAEKKPVYW